MTKRILHIIAALGQGGTERQLCLLARGLAPAEFDVHICALGRNTAVACALAEPDLPATVIGRRWPFDPQAYWRVKRHVARLRPDLIHTWSFAAGAYGCAAGAACGVKRRVSSQHGAGTQQGPLEIAVERLVARRSSMVVVDSTRARALHVYRGLPADKFRVIPRGVPLAEPSRTTRCQVLAELGLPENSRLIGLVGPLRLRHRIKDAIWAADLLKVIRDDVHLLVIGDGPHRARLRRFRDQVRIRDRVHFLDERGDVPRLMPHFDVLWSTSAYEDQGDSILEAMAAGVPVVATDIPGTRELVAHETTGYLVPVGDRAGVTRATNRLLDDASLAARLGEAGRQRALRQFSAEEMIQRHADLYRALLA